MVEFQTRCYRSTWRLHENPAILTKGRYYRAAPDAPCVTSATYLASREYAVNRFDQPHGEWGGDQFYDLGIPPHLLPQNGHIGGDCLERLRPTPAPDDAQAANRGRCIHLTTRELCGNSPVYANFSLAYETGIIRYYENVPNYVRKDEGTGEWEGAIPGLDDAYSKVTVAELMDASLAFNFILCDNGGPPPILQPCCGVMWPGVFFSDVTVSNIHLFGGTPDWVEVIPNVAFYSDPLDPGAVWEGEFTCGGVSYKLLTDINPLGGGLCGFRSFLRRSSDNVEIYADPVNSLVGCSPPRMNHSFGPRDIGPFSSRPDFCGHLASASPANYYLHCDFDLLP